MDCLKFRELIIPYLDEEVDPITKIEFENHLKNCTSCKALFTSVRSTYTLIEKERVRPENPFFYNSLIIKLNEPKESKVIELVTTILKPLAVAASITIGILIGNGEVSLNTTSDTDLEAISETIVPLTPSDYSVWITMNDYNGN